MMNKITILIFVSLLIGSTALAQDDCGCESKTLPEVLAIVNGVKITARDLDQDTQSRILELKRQVVEARKLELELQINSMLLEAEAKKRAVSSSRLLQDEVIKKAQEPTAAEARNFFNEQQGRITDSSGKPVEFEQVKDRVMAHLRAERQQELAKKFAERLRSTTDLKMLVDVPTPPAKPTDRQRLFATLHGQQITSGDIEDGLQPFTFSVQEQMYELRRRDLDRKINDVLLAQEAQKRQVTTRALLETEVSAKAPAVTEAEAQKFYDANKDRTNGAFTDLKEQILRYLQKTETEKLQLAFAANLRKTAAIEDFLNPPEPPIYQIATDDQPAKGDVKAPVTLVEFTDFQCPRCAELQPLLDKLVQEYSGRLRLVVRDYPLSRHENAFKAAEAAEAAREQGRYWEYTARLFSNQTALTIDKLKQYASELKLDQAKFNAALDSGKFTDQIQRDLLEGRRVGVRGTPSLFINGKLVSDRSYEALKQAIDSTLNARK